MEKEDANCEHTESSDDTEIYGDTGPIDYRTTSAHARQSEEQCPGRFIDSPEYRGELVIVESPEEQTEHVFGEHPRENSPLTVGERIERVEDLSVARSSEDRQSTETSEFSALEENTPRSQSPKDLTVRDCSQNVSTFTTRRFSRALRDYYINEPFEYRGELVIVESPDEGPNDSSSEDKRTYVTKRAEDRSISPVTVESPKSGRSSCQKSPENVPTTEASPEAKQSVAPARAATTSAPVASVDSESRESFGQAHRLEVTKSPQTKEVFFSDSSEEEIDPVFSASLKHIAQLVIDESSEEHAPTSVTESISKETQIFQFSEARDQGGTSRISLKHKTSTQETSGISSSRGTFESKTFEIPLRPGTARAEVFKSLPQPELLQEEVFRTSPQPGPSRVETFRTSPQPGPSRLETFRVSPEPGPSRLETFRTSPQPGPSRGVIFKTSPQAGPSRVGIFRTSLQPGPSRADIFRTSPQPEPFREEIFRTSSQPGPLRVETLRTSPQPGPSRVEIFRTSPQPGPSRVETLRTSPQPGPSRADIFKTSPPPEPFRGETFRILAQRGPSQTQTCRSLPSAQTSQAKTVESSPEAQSSRPETPVSSPEIGTSRPETPEFPPELETLAEERVVSSPDLEPVRTSRVPEVITRVSHKVTVTAKVVQKYEPLTVKTRVAKKVTCPTTYRRKYRREWEDIRSFKGWLTGVPEKPTAAYCKICKVTFCAKISDIKSHSLSKRHQTASTAISSTFNFSAKNVGPIRKTTGLHSLDVASIVTMYKELARIPQPIEAYSDYFDDGRTLHITSTWQTINSELGKKITYVRYYASTLDDEKALSFNQCGLPELVEESTVTARSPSGKFKVILRESTHEGKIRQYLEIWDCFTNLDNIDLTSTGIHGHVYTKGAFFCLEWGNVENKLVYIAERKKPEVESFLSREFHLDKERGTQFQYDDNFGEQLEDVWSPIICVLNANTMAITVLDELPEACYPAEIIWTADDTGIVFVGYQEAPYRLGLADCANRHSKLYHYEFENKIFSSIGEPNKAIYSPRFSPDGLSLIYLQNEVDGPARQSSKLLICHWENRAETEIDVLVDIVKHPKNDDFPGLYLERLPKFCWANDSATIFLSTIWHSSIEMVTLNANTKQLTRLSQDDEIGRWEVLFVRDNLIIVAVSSLSRAPRLLIGILTPEGAISYWVPLDAEEVDIIGISWSIMNIPLYAHNDKTFDAILITPKRGKKFPLVVWPHSGPHSSFDTGFQFKPALFVKCGFAVLLVNYRGSLGYGENVLRSLVGRIGVQDVFDVQRAADIVADKREINPMNIFVYGEGHGGFLAAHAIGQYPDFYRAAAMRNPIIDLTTSGPTDIPDVLWYESGLPGDFVSDHFPTGDDLKDLWLKSPIRYAKKIKAPTFLMLGSNDRRVDMSQGMRLYRLLKGRNVTTRCNIYNDDDQLSKPAHDADCMINTIIWFRKYLKL